MVTVIVAILSLLLLPVISQMRARAQRVQCMANLKSLYTGAELFVQQNGSWPQIRMSASESDTDEQDYARLDRRAYPFWSDAADLDLSHDSGFAAESGSDQAGKRPHRLRRDAV